MNYISTGIYIIQLVLYYLISYGHAQGNVKNIIVKVSRTNCTVNGGNICRNKYLQICYSSTKKQICGRTMPSDCLFPPGSFDTSRTKLTAEVGSNSSYDSFTPITTFAYIVVGITPTTSTQHNPLATSCEESRNTTKNGFRVKTRSTDGYQFEILIENICTNPTFCGPLCDTCDPTTTLSSKMFTTSDIRSAINTSTTTFTTPRLRSTVLSDGTTTGYKTVQASSGVTDSSSTKVTSEDTSTVGNNGTNNSTSNLFKSENSSNQSRLLTIIIALVSCIVVILIVVITIYKCYRKHNRLSKTTPSGHDKKCLVENDNTAGEDAYSGTSHSNGLQNHNENRHRENASNEGVAHITTETIDETVNNTGDDGNGSVSANQNETNDINSETVNNERIESEVINFITETPEDMEQRNIGMETESSVPVTHSNAEVLYFPLAENNVIASGQNNGYVPDDEHSDAAPSNENEEVSRIDDPTQNNGDAPQQAQSNGDVLKQAQSNGDVPHQAHACGDIPHRAQSRGEFHHQEISIEEIENIAQAKVETLIHDKIGEFKREMTEDTNNFINQVKEELTDKMCQQSDEIKEQFSKNANAERKREDQIRECSARLQIFEDAQKQLEERIKASGGIQDNDRLKLNENTNDIQTLRDEMNGLKEQPVSQHEDAHREQHSPLLTRTSQVDDSSPNVRTETIDLLHSRTNTDDVSQDRPNSSLETPGKPPASAKKRRKKKKNPSIQVSRDGSVKLKRENNKSIDFGNMGSIEFLHLKDGVRFTADSLVVEVKSADYDVIE